MSFIAANRREPCNLFSMYPISIYPHNVKYFEDIPRRFISHEEENFYYIHYGDVEEPFARRVHYSLYEKFSEAISILIYSP